MEEFLHWLQGTMTEPTWFGWFHILWICIMIAECIVIYIFRKKISKKILNVLLLSTGLALIIFEIYKQIIFSFNYNGGGGIRRGHINGMPFHSNFVPHQCT